MTRARLRTVLAVALIVLGTPLLLAGAATAVYVGPDDTVEYARADVGGEGSVAATAVGIATVTGPVLHVSARMADDGDVFVGVGHRIHVDSYLDGVAQQTVTAADLRGEVTSSSEDGSPAPAAPPGDLDWWESSASGSGWRGVSYELTDEPVRVVVMSPSASGEPLDVELSLGVEVDGIFVTAVLVGVGGLLLIGAGVLLIWLRRRRRKRERALRVVPDEEKDEAPKPPPDEPGEKDPKDEQPAPEPEKVATVTPLPKRPLPERTPPPPAPAPPPKPSARIAVVLGLTGLVTACAQVPGEIDAGARDALIPAITSDRAEGFFEQYNEVVGAAASGSGDAPLADVEGGALLATSQFAAEEQAATGAVPEGPPSAVTPSVVLSPQVGEYPMWAIVTGQSSAGGAPSWFLLTRENAASPWLASLAVHPAEGTSVTAPLTADGAAVVADDDATRRGDEVLEALRAYGETGEEPEGIDLTLADGLTNLPAHGLQLGTAPPEFGTATRSCAVEDAGRTHWLQTEYGAVTLASISCTQSVTVNPGYSVVIEAAGLGTIPGGSQISQAEISQNATFILSVDTDGSATVIGQRMQPIGMTWSLP
ncbi:hypothetical protein [Jiangella muralis]|uniref:hypothetical protein n=1 Tax=Jiangella muralis TaxID=702383 RepID=UPI00069F1FE9|nr:hypothetical protein [Jiangella muralis]